MANTFHRQIQHERHEVAELNIRTGLAEQFMNERARERIYSKPQFAHAIPRVLQSIGRGARYNAGKAWRFVMGSHRGLLNPQSNIAEEDKIAFEEYVQEHMSDLGTAVNTLKSEEYRETTNMYGHMKDMDPATLNTMGLSPEQTKELQQYLRDYCEDTLAGIPSGEEMHRDLAKVEAFLMYMHEYKIQHPTFAHSTVFRDFQNRITTMMAIAAPRGPMSAAGYRASIPATFGQVTAVLDPGNLLTELSDAVRYYAISGDVIQREFLEARYTYRLDQMQTLHRTYFAPHAQSFFPEDKSTTPPTPVTASLSIRQGTDQNSFYLVATQPAGLAASPTDVNKYFPIEFPNGGDDPYVRIADTANQSKLYSIEELKNVADVPLQNLLNGHPVETEPEPLRLQDLNTYALIPSPPQLDCFAMEMLQEKLDMAEHQNRMEVLTTMGNTAHRRRASWGLFRNPNGEVDVPTDWHRLAQGTIKTGLYAFCGALNRSSFATFGLSTLAATALTHVTESYLASRDPKLFPREIARYMVRMSTAQPTGTSSIANDPALRATMSTLRNLTANEDTTFLDITNVINSYPSQRSEQDLVHVSKIIAEMTETMERRQLVHRVEYFQLKQVQIACHRKIAEYRLQDVATRIRNSTGTTTAAYDANLLRSELVEHNIADYARTIQAKNPMGADVTTAELYERYQREVFKSNLTNFRALGGRLAYGFGVAAGGAVLMHGYGAALQVMADPPGMEQVLQGGIDLMKFAGNGILNVESWWINDILIGSADYIKDTLLGENFLAPEFEQFSSQLGGLIDAAQHNVEAYNALKSIALITVGGLGVYRYLIQGQKLFGKESDTSRFIATTKKQLKKVFDQAAKIPGVGKRVVTSKPAKAAALLALLPIAAPVLAVKHTHKPIRRYWTTPRHQALQPGLSAHQRTIRYS